MPVSGIYSPESLDRTYALFIVPGLLTLVMVSIFTLDPKNSEGWGMLLAPTLALPGILAWLIALIRSLMHWRHRPLLLLALSPVLVYIVGVIGGVLGCETASVVALSVYAAFMILVPVCWFAKGRRSYREMLQPAKQAIPPPHGLEE